MKTSLAAYPETRSEVCAALHYLEVGDVKTEARLYELHHKLASASYHKATASISTPLNKLTSAIERAFAAMDASPENEGTQFFQLAVLYACTTPGNAMTESASTPVAAVVIGGLRHIDNAMKLSARCANYGCRVVSSCAKHCPKTFFENGGTRIVLDALNGFGDEGWVDGTRIHVVELLHALVTSSSDNAAEVAKESDVASIIVAAKHALIRSPELVEKCNFILISL
jgi:hypothetical protein